MFTKKNIFDLSFNTGMQPGSETRFLTMDTFLGEAKINPSQGKMTRTLADKRDLRKVFKSFQAPEMLPSLYTRLGRRSNTK